MGVGTNNLDGQCVVFHEILSFALLHCMEWRGKPINPCKTCGNVSTTVDVDDEKWLAWAIYDSMLLPRDPPQLQGQHDSVQIMAGTYCLMFWEENYFDHCTAASFDVKQAARKAKQQRHQPCNLW